MVDYTWTPYVGAHAILLAVILLVIAGVIAFLGFLWKTPRGVQRPGLATAIFMLIIWGLSIYTFLVAYVTYAVQLKQVGLLSTAPSNPITVVTFSSAIVAFLLIAYLTRRRGWKIALLSAFVGAAAAPMIFELPFDLIVFNHTFPPVPPAPVLYREIFFFPLFIVEFSTLSLLTFSPAMRLSRYTFFALAAMFLVFAVWATQGFSYPSDLTTIALNDISKVLCFVVSITLFVGDKRTVPDTQDSPTSR